MAKKVTSPAAGQQDTPAPVSAPSNSLAKLKSLQAGLFKTAGELAPVEGMQALNTEGGGTTPYIQFFHPNAKNAGNMIQALGVQTQGQPILVEGSTFTKLNPLTFFITPTFYQYYATTNDQSEPIDAIPPVGRCNAPYTEFIEALVLLVVNPEDIKPVRMRLRGPKCKGYKDAHTYLTNELGDETLEQIWSGKGKEQRALVESGLPNYLWFLNNALITQTQPKKVGGRPYETMDTQQVFTPLGIASTVVKCLEDEKFQQGVADCTNDLMKRFKEVIQPLLAKHV